ncbi:hypothetical protein CDL15_Pgr007334 [Punica granatum]|uniref:Uncharacterized protein n=1 Tax=Punica granatum TaxID=22663 RepID=A0A218X9E3_PUNGR|nr:hypothetical protein CDL15_Pgr007334 [Punica granatum]
MIEFRQILRQAYALKVTNVRDIIAEKPTVSLISRNETWRILNEESMVQMMEELGFRVIIAGPDMMCSLEEVARTVSSCSLMEQASPTSSSCPMVQ